ncbi:hypothetical protein [Rhodoblastus sp.]|uniref:hypothetical protein n=1 Tax=Rhodoblastus sp. TaxID=1962975 RepID=UPI0025EBE9A2|nr:hypothetical protein [Rhodoblastus sp.]
MLRKIVFGTFAAAILLIAAPAEARYDSRSYSGFGSGHCKRSSCFAKHPGGVYHYPYHYGHRH